MAQGMQHCLNKIFILKEMRVQQDAKKLFYDNRGALHAATITGFHPRKQYVDMTLNC